MSARVVGGVAAARARSASATSVDVRDRDAEGTASGPNLSLRSRTAWACGAPVGDGPGTTADRECKAWPAKTLEMARAFPRAAALRVSRVALASARSRSACSVNMATARRARSLVVAETLPERPKRASAGRPEARGASSACVPVTTSLCVVATSRRPRATRRPSMRRTRRRAVWISARAPGVNPRIAVPGDPQRCVLLDAPRTSIAVTRAVVDNRVAVEDTSASPRGGHRP